MTPLTQRDDLARGGTTLVCVVFALLALVAPAGAHTAKQNRAAAAADAAQLIARVQLPDGATALDSEPAGDGGVLAQPPSKPRTPNLVLQTKWFRVAAGVDAVMQWAESHPPAGGKLDMEGEGDGATGSYSFRGFAWPALRGKLSTRWLLVTAAPLDDGSTAVRVDAEVVWVSPRPKGERIPSSARHLTIVSGKRTIRVRGAATVRRIARALNSAETFQPGVVACGFMRAGETAPVLLFRHSARGRVLARVVIHPTFCPEAEVRIGGSKMPALTPSKGLLAVLNKLGAI